MWILHPASREPLGGGPGGYEAWSQVRAGDGALHVFSTQMVLVAVSVGEVAGDSAHSRNDISRSTGPWRTPIYTGRAEPVTDKESAWQTREEEQQAEEQLRDDGRRELTARLLPGPRSSQRHPSIHPLV